MTSLSGEWVESFTVAVPEVVATGGFHYLCRLARVIDTWGSDLLAFWLSGLRRWAASSGSPISTAGALRYTVDMGERKHAARRPLDRLLAIAAGLTGGV